MISRTLFASILQNLKDQYIAVENATKTYLSSNPFLEDARGVSATFLTNATLQNVENLFAAVNESIVGKTLTLENGDTLDVLKDLAEYFVLECDWGGYIEDPSLCKSYNLENYDELYSYIVSL